MILFLDMLILRCCWDILVEMYRISWVKGFGDEEDVLVGNIDVGGFLWLVVCGLFGWGYYGREYWRK